MKTTKEIILYLDYTQESEDCLFFFHNYFDGEYRVEMYGVDFDQEFVKKALVFYDSHFPVIRHQGILLSFPLFKVFYPRLDKILDKLTKNHKKFT